MTLDLSTSLEQLIQREISPLRAFPEDKTGVHADASSWSSKEELGHLIDSAANNHVRFVRAMIEPEFRGPTYAQDDWVRVHRYQEMAWLTMVDFWFQYNSFLVSLLRRVPEEKTKTLCYVGTGEGVSLSFLVEDYVLHMQHHIDHLLGREKVTKYPA